MRSPGRQKWLGGSHSGLHVPENTWLLLSDQRITQVRRVPISKLGRQEGFVIEQNATIHQFYGFHLS
jgi:hypothetical protein